MNEPINRTTMRCLQCAYPLDGLLSQACPECGAEFDADDPESFQRVLDDPVRLVRLPVAEASAAHLALERQGIEAFKEPDASGIIGHIDLPHAWICVPRATRTAAENILRELTQRKSQAAAWKCPNCGETIEPQFEACWNCEFEHAESN